MTNDEDIGGAESSEQVFQVFRGRDTNQPGPSYQSLQEALDFIRSNRADGPYDILMPDGEWYGRRKTVRSFSGGDEPTPDSECIPVVKGGRSSNW